METSTQQAANVLPEILALHDVINHNAGLLADSQELAALRNLLCETVPGFWVGHDVMSCAFLEPLGQKCHQESVQVTPSEFTVPCMGLDNNGASAHSNNAHL